MGGFFSKISEYFKKPEYEGKTCKGLKDCNKNIIEFYKSINDENCPLHVEKIKRLIQCYNNSHPNEPLQINLNTNDLTELLTTEEDLKDLDKASQWLELQMGNRIDNVHPEDLDDFITEYSEKQPLLSKKMIGGKRTKKSRKMGKTKSNRSKSKKSRK